MQPAFAQSLWCVYLSLLHVGTAVEGPLCLVIKRVQHGLSYQSRSSMGMRSWKPGRGGDCYIYYGLELLSPQARRELGCYKVYVLENS